jgi:hypothetical protein
VLAPLKDLRCLLVLLKEEVVIGEFEDAVGAEFEVGGMDVAEGAAGVVDLLEGEQQVF